MDSEFFDDYAEKYKLVKDPNTSAEILEKLANEPSTGVLKTYIAENPNTSIDTLNKLVKEGRNLPYYVAKNPNCPVTLLKDIFKYGDGDAKYSVLKHKNCPEIIKLLYK